MKTKIMSQILYISAFLLPILIFLSILVSNEIVPFGDNTLVSGDLEIQVVPFYSELSEKLNSGGSLFYSWKRGMGNDFLIEAAYYLISPINIILIFFSNKTLPLAISVIVMIKCGFAGLNMSIYLKKHFYKDNIITKYNLLLILAFSCCYALSAYIINYYELLMWIDCVVLLPIVLLSLERLLENDKPFLYSIYLGITIITNYYIGYMVCIFCVIYFMYLLFINYNKIPKVKLLKSVIRFFSYSALAGALSAVIIIPQAYALSTMLTDHTGLENAFEVYYSPIVFFYRSMTTAFPRYSLHPYLYCGDIIFVLLPLYFLNGKFPLKQRTGKMIIMILLLLSMQVNCFEYIWNGFHSPNGYFGRNSFIAVFFVLVICMESFINLKIEKSKFFIHYLAILLLLFITSDYYGLTSVFFNILKNLAIITIYFIIIFLCSRKRLFTIFLSFILIFELSYNFNHSLYNKMTLTSYETLIDEFNNAVSDIDTSGYYRIKNDSKNHKNQSSLCNYNSISTVSSAANQNLLYFLSDLGFYCTLNAYNDIAWEPVFGSIFCEKYIISPYDYLESDYLKKVKSTENQYVYENKNSLSLGFEVKSSVIKPYSFNGENPFERINSFANAVGCNKVYKKTNVYLSDDKSHIFFESDKDIYLYSKDLLTDKEFISKTHSEPIYPFSNSPTIKSSYIHDNYICHIATAKNGGYIPISEDIPVDDIVAYSLNHNNFNKLMEILSANQLHIEKFDDTNIKGDIDASYDGIIMTSIPYSKGWSVKIDGKKIKTLSIKNALLAFPINKGYHNIEFSYMTVGFIPGIFVSICALLLLIADIIRYLYTSKKLKIK